MTNKSALPYSTIAQAWDYFSRSVIKKPISDWQREEMKRVFYAGASCCFDIITLKTLDLSEADGVKKIESVYQEFTAFAVELQNKITGKQS